MLISAVVLLMLVILLQFSSIGIAAQNHLKVIEKYEQILKCLNDIDRALMMESELSLMTAKALQQLSQDQDRVAMQTKAVVELMLSEPGKALIDTHTKGGAN